MIPKDTAVAAGDLGGDIAGHIHLPRGYLATVGMAGVDHDPCAPARLGQHRAGIIHREHIVVRVLATAQDDMAVLIARGLENRRAALLGHRQEIVGLRGGPDRIDSHLDIAIGSVLEPHRAGQPGGQFTVSLALGSTRTDRAPGNQVSVVLRADEIQVFGAGGQAHLCQVQQQLPGQVQTLVDLEGVIQVRVVDQALPPDRGARLFEVNTHHHEQVTGIGVRSLAATGPRTPGPQPDRESNRDRQ